MHPNQHSQYASPGVCPSSKDATLGSMLDTTLLMDTQTYEPMETFHSTFVGARIKGNFVHQRARIKILEPNATEPCLPRRPSKCLQSRISQYQRRRNDWQEAYLCTGTHDFANPPMPLQVGATKSW